MSDKIGESSSSSAEGEKPPHYNDIMGEVNMDIICGEDNKGYAADVGEVKVKVANSDDIPTEDDERSALSAEEEQMLSILREVVRKCTHANPTKRPTAAEVLKMLKVIKLPEIED